MQVVSKKGGYFPLIFLKPNTANKKTQKNQKTSLN